MEKGIVIDREAKYIGVYIPARNKIFTGIPRKKVLKKTKIYAGDYVLGEILDNENFSIEEIEARKNLLKRPSVANVDNAIIVQAFKMPPFDSLLLDNLLVVYEYFAVEPVIVFNKVDLLNQKEKNQLENIVNIYKDAGYKVHKISALNNEGIEDLTKYLKNSISIVAGQSGVGKSSIVSKLTGKQLETKEVSKKTERGRHTTTGVRLYKFGENSFIADTPGFSKIDALTFMDKREVPKYFREFSRYSCKFPDCMHTVEPDCKVKKAVKNKEISCNRYKNYLKIINADLGLLSGICD